MFHIMLVIVYVLLKNCIVHIRCICIVYICNTFVCIYVINMYTEIYVYRYEYKMWMCIYVQIHTCIYICIYYVSIHTIYIVHTSHCIYIIFVIYKLYHVIHCSNNVIFFSRIFIWMIVRQMRRTSKRIRIL